ncbi:hemin ABC transporter ATP-binding protein (plasmid) [Azospirillum baldaniorum]|uniref:ATP-binding cassette domain-containing protein n=1 Tax=Azospirillum baldaniorum TaxID=1064539 RepID=UPI000D6031A4|nr:ATP-binding cassette domain-containing protein [Azospirillum baldaniorum]AWJ93182.1 hemin ABC transporter ATP-binding protein [Azospirillum baldaniorum]TWA77873.1 iron complex transport system ATP-binding protein [Azospirillum brasilense]
MLEAIDAGLTIGRARLLDGVTAAVRPGRVLAILGPNGAGKSTLLSLLSGERRPTAGRALLDGVAMAAIPAPRLAVRRALVAQHQQVAFAFSVEEVMELATEPWLIRPCDRRALIADCLMRAGAGGLAGRLMPQLSGGERQRVAFARALAQLAAGRHGRDVAGPSYLLLDEPTASLDPAHQHHLLRAARDWVERTGGGCAVILHDLTLAARYADDGLLLAGGRVAWTGSMTGLPVPVLERVFGTAFVRLDLPEKEGVVYAATGRAAASGKIICE